MAACRPPSSDAADDDAGNVEGPVVVVGECVDVVFRRVLAPVPLPLRLLFVTLLCMTPARMAPAESVPLRVLELLLPTPVRLPFTFAFVMSDVVETFEGPQEEEEKELAAV